MANEKNIEPHKFEKGKTGNPKGRPKGVPNAATRLQRFLNLIQKGKNPVTKEDEEFTVAELMDLKQIAKALNGDTVAWDKINDRLEGKAMQRNENSGPDGGPMQFDINAAALSKEDKRAVLALLDKAKTNE